MGGGFSSAFFVGDKIFCFSKNCYYLCAIIRKWVSVTNLLTKKIL